MTPNSTGQPMAWQIVFTSNLELSRSVMHSGV